MLTYADVCTSWILAELTPEKVHIYLALCMYIIYAGPIHIYNIQKVYKKVDIYLASPCPKP